MQTCNTSQNSPQLDFQTCGDPQLERMEKAALEWLHAFKVGLQPRWITLLGTCGIGKTHLAQRLFTYANSRIDKPKTPPLSYIPHVVYWPDFVQQLRSGERFFKRDDMKRWPILCLDDIGAERDTTGFAQEELNTLVGGRMGRWLILTSNLTLERLSQIDARIASRIIRGNNIWCDCKAQDYALRTR